LVPFLALLTPKTLWASGTSDAWNTFSTTLGADNNPFDDGRSRFFYKRLLCFRLWFGDYILIDWCLHDLFNENE
jgi:hypothetical protein